MPLPSPSPLPETPEDCRALLLALLAACGKPVETTDAGSTRPADAVVTETGRNAGQVAAEVRQDVRDAGQVVTDKAKDVAITTVVRLPRHMATRAMATAPQ